MTSQGLGIDETDIFVDAVALDSMSFASGKVHWLLSGLLIVDGEEYPYHIVYDTNPLKEHIVPRKVTAPDFFSDRSDKIKTLVTEDGNRQLRISWRLGRKVLCVKTVLTSVR